MTATKHSPLPWTSDPDAENFVTVEGANGTQVCNVDLAANAAFIVRAVNAHEELVRLLAELVSNGKSDTDCGEYDAAVDLLSRLQETQG